MAQRSRKQTNKTRTLLWILAIVVAADIFIFAGLRSSIMPRDTQDLRRAPTEPEVDERQETIVPPETVPTLPDNITELTVRSDELHCGELILVNNDHAYIDTVAPAVISKETPADVYTYKSSDYVILDTSIDLNLTVIRTLNSLFADYKAYSGKVNVMINAAWRSIEQQEAIFAEKGADIAANPGYSEHHSGYALDICIYENGKGRTFADEEPYVWIPQNCSKYGYIRRYPEGKTAITGITHEPWHYRYVGIPHATYMTQNSLTLEEYIDALKQYSFAGNHLLVSENNTEYEIWYVPATNELTSVPVPNDREYTLSGNNVDGFIVTVNNSSVIATEPDMTIDADTAA